MGNFFSTLLQEVRFALRTARKSPGFTCAALLTLALGIGANTAIYTIIDGVSLHPIPFANPEKLAAVIGVAPRSIRIAGADDTFQNDVFTPIGQCEVFEFYSHGLSNGTLGLGRLKHGATLAQAR